MSRMVTTWWSLAPAVSQLSLMGSRATVSDILFKFLSPRARQAPAVRARSFSSNMRDNNGVNYARIVPVISASTGVAIGYYLYQQGPGPLKIGLVPEEQKCAHCIYHDGPCYRGRS
ncbi:hypothetical protein DER46DRAFT_689106 [Fusarium sp. MPI-SDFR-AT-0072]|nr:hypothetical protein DER46DRAFT_689106 [Fusarium sp. MPI-SDFR-AT-0072]